MQAHFVYIIELPWTHALFPNAGLSYFTIAFSESTLADPTFVHTATDSNEIGELKVNNHLNNMNRAVCRIVYQEDKLPADLQLVCRTSGKQRDIYLLWTR